MGVTQRAWWLGRSVAGACSMPATAAHEATHAILSMPWADRVVVSLKPRIAVGVEWRDGTPFWAVWIAHWGPAILGSVIGILGGLRLVRGGAPETGIEWVKLGVLAMLWVIYTTPSKGDREVTQ